MASSRRQRLLKGAIQSGHKFVLAYVHKTRSLARCIEERTLRLCSATSPKPVVARPGTKPADRSQQTDQRTPINSRFIVIVFQFDVGTQIHCHYNSIFTQLRL